MSQYSQPSTLNSQPSAGELAIFLMGPTASGKSQLAMALAARLPVEIISVDSAQVFRDMNVGTAKPSPAERASVPHHLIDIISPVEAYSAARFRDDALRLLHEINGRGRLPVLVGGTMLYFKALREGLTDLPPADATVRAEIDAEAQERGWPALHAELAKVDPETAARLQPGDAQRIQRALEIQRIAGQPMSQLIADRREYRPPFRSVSIALVPSDRHALHGRIEARFTAMLKAGLAEELRALRTKYSLSPRLPSMRSVGYRQAWQYLEGELDEESLRERGIYATRQLAKRQLTWLRAMTDATVLDCLEPSITGKALDLIRLKCDATYKPT